MEATNVHPPRISEFGTLDQSLGFRIEDTNCLNLSYIQKHAYFYSKIWCFIVFWQPERCESSGSKDKSNQKTLRRLAQNCEAARKSRLRKKAYQQQLESSRFKLTQLEQELQRARQQVWFCTYIYCFRSKFDTYPAILLTQLMYFFEEAYQNRLIRIISYLL
ncbi:hypothetical protein GLYMA_09G184300v4 [Glycine max]|uniref:BZIP domain-containing protein n=1 Tax=Glycine max TaxID=3847 RepID=A0A0R0H3W8_SOYBN|nr:hypothetical protein GLYMA_09G184300v4 [Glycine max]